METPKRRSGLVLLVVVGVLGVLVVLSTAFVTLAQLERRASQQRLQGTKALLLARSGLEDALARLSAGQDPGLPESAYGGEDWDGLGGSLSAFEAQQEVFRTGSANTEDCPLPQAMRPSFFARVQPSPNPALQTVEGRQRGYSGALQGGNTYALKILTQGGIYLNGGDPSQVPTEYLTPYWHIPYPDYNLMLRGMLGTLAKAVDEAQDGGIDGLPVGEADGFNLIDRRPRTSRGWESWEQVRDLALGGSQAKLDALKSSLALQARVDRKVIRPNYSLEVGFQYSPPTWAEIKKIHSSPTTGKAAPDFERIPLTASGRIVGRAPVDLAWARTRKPVLIALLSGLRGICWPHQVYGEFYSGFAPMPWYLNWTPVEVMVQNAWSPADDAHRIADRIAAFSGPLETWSQWNAFCDAIPDACLTGTSDERVAKRDILKANFNPNSDLNKFNPNPSLWKTVDKSDLVAYSTEFSLLGVCDRELESLGRVLDRSGRLLASRTVRATLAADAVLRLDTQKEFLCEDLGDPDTAGDEKDLRTPGFTRAGCPELITQSAGSDRTWGYTQDAGSRYPGSWMNGDSRGVSLQTYPEPCVTTGPGSGLSVNAADYDGNLQLATVETRAQDPYGCGMYAPARMMMLARFDDAFDLDVHDGAGACVPDVQQVTQAAGASELSKSLLDTDTPNTLYPDGCYSELGRTPVYYDRDNTPGRHGLMSFWVKNNWATLAPTTGLPNPPRTIPHAYVKRSNMIQNWSSDGNSPNQMFFIGMSQFFGSFQFMLFVEEGHSGDTPTSGKRAEHLFGTPDREILPRRWYLLTTYWNFDDPDYGSGAVVADWGVGPGDFASFDQYSTALNDPSVATDITLPDLYGAHRMALGGMGTTGPMQDCLNRSGSALANAGADATLDEFAVYDFGVNYGAARTYAFQRYLEGRYYKCAMYSNLDDLLHAPLGDEAATYFTPPLRLPAGAFLKRAHWTWLRGPGAQPDDYAEIELTDLAGVRYLDEAGGDGSARTRSTRDPGWSKDRQAWDARHLLRTPFRAHVVFRRESMDPEDPTMVDENSPILDSPVFDDLSLVYSPTREGFRLSVWRQGE